MQLKKKNNSLTMTKYSTWTIYFECSSFANKHVIASFVLSKHQRRFSRFDLCHSIFLSIQSIYRNIEWFILRSILMTIDTKVPVSRILRQQKTKDKLSLFLKSKFQNDFLQSQHVDPSCQFHVDHVFPAIENLFLELLNQCQ